jgi:hypothetical protein
MSSALILPSTTAVQIAETENVNSFEAERPPDVIEGPP